MSWIARVFDFVMNLEQHLVWLIDKFGSWSYLMLFFVIFMETGFVFTPFLPGDSLIFTAGAFSSLGVLNVWILFIILSLASIIGDSANYAIGHFVGDKILAMNSRFIKKHHIDRAHRFYEKHGGEAIILARFIPIVRTFTPFIAGVGRMTYLKFLAYNVIGGFAWVALFLFGGYFFGNIPFVKNNFMFVIAAIVIMSLTPVLIEYARYLKKKKDKKNKRGKNKQQKKK